STTDLLMGEIKNRTQTFDPNDDISPPKKANDDSVTSFQTTDPFSSANYGPNAPATAQQARMDVFKKLYGLTDDSDTKKTAPVSSQVATTTTTDTKLKADDGFQAFYGEKPPTPMVGSIAPVAPTAPPKPSMEPVSASKPSSTYEKNPLFISPTMVLPKRPFQ
ncbi:MAG TPA: hypothetical protein VH255_05230, partial [Verrucomicrobiae bacterium]|nr:hypothetical protein [Verrucomicrobiae bacterium]